jgi:hypothetical protein
MLSTIGVVATGVKPKALPGIESVAPLCAFNRLPIFQYNKRTTAMLKVFANSVIIPSSPIS